MLGIIKSDFDKIEKDDYQWYDCIDYWYIDPSGKRIDQNDVKEFEEHWRKVRERYNLSTL